MPTSVNTGGRAEVMLTKTVEKGEGKMCVALRAGVKILTDLGMRLPSSPPIVV